MNKTVLGIIVAVVVIGAGAYFFTGGAVPEGMMPAGNGAQQQQVNKPLTLKELLASDAVEQCTFIDNTDTTAAQGTVYVGGGKARGDFSSTQQGKTVYVHMIADGTTMHTWADGMKDGIAISMTATKPADAPQGYDADKKMDYHCMPWTVDATKFDLPKGVNFRDVAGMMKSVTIPEMPTR